MSKKKPGMYPTYLYNAAECGIEGRRLFLCSGCGGPYWLAAVSNGPFRYVGPCWRSQEYGVKCVTPAQDRFLYSADLQYTMKPPEQIEPDDKWDHSICADHFRHPAFKKRLCLLPGQDMDEARAFADQIAAVTR